MSSSEQMKRAAATLGQSALDLIMGKLELIHGALAVPSDEENDDRTDFIFAVMNEVMEFRDSADVELIKRGIRKARNHFYRGPSDQSVELSNLRETVRVQTAAILARETKISDLRTTIQQRIAEIDELNARLLAIHKIVAPTEFTSAPDGWEQEAEDERTDLTVKEIEIAAIEAADEDAIEEAEQAA